MPHNKVAFDWMDENWQIFKPMDSIVNVGWRKGSDTIWVDRFGPKCGATKFGLIEIFKENYQLFSHDKVIAYHADLADFETVCANENWHTVFWDHGPEHAQSEEQLVEITKMLKRNVQQIIYACPWGHCPQNASYGNKYEEHAVTFLESTVELLEMDSYKTFNYVNTHASGEIISWWKKNK